MFEEVVEEAGDVQHLHDGGDLGLGGGAHAGEAGLAG